MDFTSILRPTDVMQNSLREVSPDIISQVLRSLITSKMSIGDTVGNYGPEVLPISKPMPIVEVLPQSPRMPTREVLPISPVMPRRPGYIPNPLVGNLGGYRPDEQITDIINQPYRADLKGEKGFNAELSKAMKQPYEMTQEEFKNIPVIKYIEERLKDKTNPLNVTERNQLAKQLVDSGLMSMDDFNAMTGQHGFGGVSGSKNLTTGKPIPSKSIDTTSDMGAKINYIGQWHTFRNVPLFAHREAIVKALAEGKTVPQEVLNSYKDWSFPDINGQIGTLKEAVESYGGKLSPKEVAKGGGIVYRGINSVSGEGVGQGNLGSGIYVTPEKGMAQAFAKRHRVGEVKQYTIDPSAKLLDADSQIFIDIKKKYGLEYWEAPPYKKLSDKISEDVKALGYDGIKSLDRATGIVIFNKKHLLSPKSGNQKGNQ